MKYDQAHTSTFSIRYPCKTMSQLTLYYSSQRNVICVPVQLSCPSRVKTILNIFHVQFTRETIQHSKVECRSIGSIVIHVLNIQYRKMCVTLTRGSSKKAIASVKMCFVCCLRIYLLRMIIQFYLFVLDRKNLNLFKKIDNRFIVHKIFQKLFVIYFLNLQSQFIFILNSIKIFFLNKFVNYLF